MTEVVLIQVPFITVFLNKNNSNEYAGYYDIFIPFKGHIYSKQGSHISLLFGTWILVSFAYVWVKLILLPLTLTWQTFFLFCISFLKRFIYGRVKTYYILHGATIPVTVTATGLEPRTTWFVNEHLTIWPNWPFKWLSCVMSTYLYGAFYCTFLSCHVYQELRQYLFISSRKSFPRLKLSTACSK